MKNIPLDLTLKQLQDTLSEGSFSEAVEADKTEQAKNNSCWNGYVLMEVHIDKLRESVERERLEVQEGGCKDGIRSKRRWEKGSGLQIKG